MSSQEKADHWRQLAEELGAEIPPEPEEVGAAAEAGPLEQTIGPEVTPPPAVAPPPPPRPVPVRRTACDWTRLVQELGVDVPPEPEPLASPVQPVSAPSREDSAGAVSEVTAEEVGLEAPWESHRPEPPAVPSPRDDERRGRRRRKKRRRPGEARGAENPRAEAVSSQSGSNRPGEVPDDAATAAVVRSEPRSTELREEPSRSRSKRRRRRRTAPDDRQRALPDREGEAGVQEAADRLADQVATDSQGLRAVEVPADEMAEKPEQTHTPERASTPPDSGSEKTLHRAIPSWKEAVNIVIAANLEARAKNPDRRSGGRGRGGQERRVRDPASEKSG